MPVPRTTSTSATGVPAPVVVLDNVTRTYTSRAGSVHALSGVTHAFAAFSNVFRRSLAAYKLGAV